jgi:ribosomal protein S18 acetylase RimI-like enzyme
MSGHEQDEQAFTERTAREDDAGALLSLVQRVPDPQGTYLPEEESAAIERKLFDGPVYVIEDGGRIVAMIAWKEDPEDPSATYIEDLAVDPEYQGRGLGKKLLEIFERSVPVDRRAMLHVHPLNDAAIKLYESFGFQRRSFADGPFGDGKLWWEMVRIPRAPDAVE